MGPFGRGRYQDVTQENVRNLQANIGNQFVKLMRQVTKNYLQNLSGVPRLCIERGLSQFHEMSARWFCDSLWKDCGYRENLYISPSTYFYGGPPLYDDPHPRPCTSKDYQVWRCISKGYQVWPCTSIGYQVTLSENNFTIYCYTYSFRQV